MEPSLNLMKDEQGQENLLRCLIIAAGASHRNVSPTDV